MIDTKWHHPPRAGKLIKLIKKKPKAGLYVADVMYDGLTLTDEDKNIILDEFKSKTKTKEGQNGGYRSKKRRKRIKSKRKKRSRKSKRRKRKSKTKRR
tara:strand:- start:1174 stop:1467 length:294 start_codon:yes stop_codon:yes gene_type:complete